jgi:hypothetical protein
MNLETTRLGPLTSTAPLPKPVVLESQKLGMGTIRCMAVSPDARKVYLGRANSYERKCLNLGVVSLDAGGEPVDEKGKKGGKAKLYLDSENSENDLEKRFGHAATIGTIFVGPKKLYLTVIYENDTTPAFPHCLTVYDLDAHGDPIGEPRTYATTNLKIDSIPPKDQFVLGSSLALHPQGYFLYLVGYSFPHAAVYAYPLKEDGEPDPSKPTKVYYNLGETPWQKYFYQVAISEGGERLYLGRSDNWLEVVNLKHEQGHLGELDLQTLRPFQAGEGSSKFLFHYTKRALYRRHERSDQNARPLYVWPLNADGGPVGTPLLQEQYSGRAEAVDPSGDTVWIAADDVFTDAVKQDDIITDGVTPAAVLLDSQGLPVGLGHQGPTSYLQVGVGGLMDVAADNHQPVLVTEPIVVIGNQVSDYWLKVSVSGPPPASPNVQLFIAPKGGSFVPFPKDGFSGFSVYLDESHQQWKPTWSMAVSLHGFLQNQAGQLLFQLSVGDPSSRLPDGLDGRQVDIKVTHGKQEDAPVLGSVTETGVIGRVVAFLLRGYGFQPPGTGKVIELMSEHARRYLRAANVTPVSPADRPRKFVVSCYSMQGGQAHLGQLETQAEAMALLGINTVNVYGWPGGNGNWPGIQPASINSKLDPLGLQRRSQGESYPPHDSYFDFKLKFLLQDKQKDTTERKDFDLWLQDQANYTPSQSGGLQGDVVEFQLSDETNWYLGSVITKFRKESYFTDPDRLYRLYLDKYAFHAPDDQTFQKFLDTMEDNKLFPRQLKDPDFRRWFYWTVRFFQESVSNGHSLLREELEKAFNVRSLHAFPAFKNGMSRWLANISTGPEKGSNIFYLDWLTCGRVNGHTLWYHSDVSDQGAQEWSVGGNLLRSAQMLGTNLEFGGYIDGKALGDHPSGASYKIFSLIGHGAKLVDLYQFGPLWLDVDGWSENAAAYPCIAGALRLLGRAEHVLFPGRRPARGKVAILLPLASLLWEDNDPDPEFFRYSRLRYYEAEAKALYYALVHAGHTVDFIDDTDLERNALTERNYTTLYITGPNISVPSTASQPDVLEKVSEWVNSGRTLVVTLGAAVSDQYNDPLQALGNVNQLNKILGLKARSEKRDPWTEAPGAVTRRLSIVDKTFGSGTMDLFGPVVPLELAGATMVAQLIPEGANPQLENPNPQAAITLNHYGNGKAIVYGFFPGVQYTYSPNRIDPQRLPLDWSPELRLLAVAPAGDKTRESVQLNHEVVEACRLQSKAGIAVVLLNWTDTPIEDLEVTVTDVGDIHVADFPKVSSAQGVPVSTRVVPGKPITITMPLKNVDVLLFE